MLREARNSWIYRSSGGWQTGYKFLAASSATSESDAATQAVYVSRVEVTRLATNATEAKPTVFIASDSTVQTYDSSYYPQTGWGQVIHNFFRRICGGKDKVIIAITVRHRPTKQTGLS